MSNKPIDADTTETATPAVTPMRDIVGTAARIEEQIQALQKKPNDYSAQVGQGLHRLHETASTLLDDLNRQKGFIENKVRMLMGIATDLKSSVEPVVVGEEKDSLPASAQRLQIGQRKFPCAGPQLGQPKSPHMHAMTPPLPLRTLETPLGVEPIPSSAIRSRG